LQKEIPMTNKIYYLASCDTCRKIIKSLPKSANLVYHDIKQDPITANEIEYMHTLSGSYEALFSRKAQLYKSLDLKNKSLTEEDYKKFNDIDKLSNETRESIHWFFSNYKSSTPNKWSKVYGFDEKEIAIHIYNKCKIQD
jgi:arsenate reductase